jgi:acetoin utilization deacetylase AcuC-like enzyme
MPTPVAIFTHPDCLLHDTGAGHPERAERVSHSIHALQQSPFAEWIHWQQADPCPAQLIEAVHSAEYRQFVEESSLCGRHSLDGGETVICDASYRAACLAAGGAVGAVDCVFNEGYRRAFSLMRPPGHHASQEKAMGFCLFNNVAIACHHARSRYAVERICIIDWDVHHGNGTQDIFYHSPAVLFCSLHQLPLYPHSGEAFETGAAAGKGLTVNCPFPNGSTIDHYLDAMEREIGPAVDAFQPECCFISAGFDAHHLDPLADIRLESEDFHALTRWIVERANRSACGRVVSFLEGGYHIDALAASICSHVRALADL